VQECLDLTIDLDYGPRTEEAVADYQARNDLPADGAVGSATWDKLEREHELPPYPPPLVELSHAVVAEISEIARNSPLASYDWADRGQAPIGYIKGMAVAYAVALTRLIKREPIAEEMARPADDPDYDALAWLDAEFDDLGMVNDGGHVTMRHLFVLLIGLGMRESSGMYCEGRDMSADNVAPETAEAGLFQMSWNASAGTTSMLGLFDAYDEADEETGYESVFAEDVSCSESDWDNYGEGDGATFQWMAKHHPMFAVECAAVGVRALRQHWGPINRKEVELRREADEMLKKIERFVTLEVEPPEVEEGPEHMPTVSITIDPPGSVRVIVEGSA
jgi:hypothetical protein